MRFSAVLAAAAALPMALSMPTLLRPAQQSDILHRRDNSHTHPSVGGSSNVPASQLGAGANPATANQNRTVKNPYPAEFVKNPTYQAFSGFDYDSIYLGVHQEYIELDLFNAGLRDFSRDDFHAAGLNDEDMSLIQFMGDQELGHAKILSNMLGKTAPKQCTYSYPYKNVREFIDFCQKLTRWGESGVYGFLPSLDNRAIAQILLQSITTEARQQMIFRQFEGLFPMPVFFETGIPQTWAWTLLSTYISSCPAENAPVQFDIFPKLDVVNDPNQLGAGQAAGGAAITHNVTALSAPGREIQLKWDSPGKSWGPYNQTTVTHGKEARYAVFVNQYNATYAPLENIKGNSATVKQPGGIVLPELTLDPIINGTSFIAIVDSNPHLTPLNLTLINNHMIAGPALYSSG